MEKVKQHVTQCWDNLFLNKFLFHIIIAREIRKASNLDPRQAKGL
jgi:hypothetical protein